MTLWSAAPARKRREHLVFGMRSRNAVFTAER